MLARRIFYRDIAGSLAMSQDTAFRVVAIRESGDRLVITEQAARDEAEALRARLQGAGAFSEVIVEVDDLQAGRDTKDDDPLQTVQL